MSTPAETWPRTVGALLQERALAEGDRNFLRCEDRKLSYAEVADSAARIAGGLRALGCGPGDPIALMMGNGLPFLLAWFGIQHLGAVAVPINTAYRGDILTHVLNDCGARIIIIDGGLVERIAAIETSLTNLARLVIEGSTESPTAYPVTGLDHLGAAEPIDHPPLRDSDPATIMYTSGTTGPSKGALLCHRGMLQFGYNHRIHAGLTRDDVCFTNLPLFHGIALLMMSIGALSASAKIAISKRFSAGRFWEEIRETGATYVAATGSIVQILHKLEPSPRDRDHAVRILYTIPVPAAIRDDFAARFGCTFLEAYGSTDGAVIVYTRPDHDRLGSCGEVIPDYELMIVDDDDEPVAPGTTGEIVYRGKRPYTLALGYHNNPGATIEAHRNFWFHSGDLGYLDEEGHLYFVDRKKDAMRRRGENISSYEVEKVFNDHPAIVKSAAVAVPSDLGEDEIKIVLVLAQDAAVDPAELLGWCEPRLAHFMLPRYVEFADDLPKTPNAKIQKYLLRKSGTAGAWDRDAAGYVVKR